VQRRAAEPEERDEQARVSGREGGGNRGHQLALVPPLVRGEPAPAGAHPKVLTALLGHSKVQLAMDVYDHVNVEELRQPLDQMLRSVMTSELSA